MASIGRKLETKGVIAMTLLTLVVMNIGCEDKIDNPVVNPSEREMVEVSLNIGFANETDGYTLSAPSTTKSAVAAFSYTLQPTAATKSEATSLKPDKLYNLEIQQYDRSGNRIGGMSSAIAEHTIGSALTLTLAANADCQLVIVAWGSGNTTRLGTDNLSSAQTKSVEASIISGLNPAVQADMNKMPFVLHLEHVCVESNTIKSVEGGSHDVRLLLRRLATRLTLSWSYSYSGYNMTQILLQSIPLDYKVISAPDGKDKTYPSLLDQFTTLQLTSAQIAANTYSCWIPTNVRGTNPAATSQTYRIKSNAPTGSSYVDFIASNTAEAKKKLSYRVYLGGSESSDFNLYSNTDYNYTVKIAHTDLPINDRRVTIIDPIPASQSNNNLVPTGNCFMVVPGGAFCFNPYKYYVNGAITDNATLQGWCASNKIKSVKVLWQTRESGDVGDPVLGVVNNATDHTNIVDLSDGDSFANARIYCRVAPNTTGGSGMIAAYDGANGTGNILWSWHIWITDYRPSATENNSVDDPNKRIQKYTYGNHGNRLPMMDRNLGAMAGYTEIPANELDRSKANGFHYQWGRKDPFPSSYTDKAIQAVPLSVDKPTPMMLNLYQPDGFSFFKRGYNSSAVSRQTSCNNPTTLYNDGGGKWCNETAGEWWGGNTAKTVNDPCPAGWRVADKNTYLSFFQDVSYSGSANNNRAAVAMNIGNLSTALKDGGVLLYFEGAPASNGRRTFLRLTGYQNLTSQFSYIGQMSNLWCRERSGDVHAYMWVFNNGGLNWKDIAHNVAGNWSAPDAHTLRCIQDR